MLPLNSIDEIILISKEKPLYNKLVLQLKKDFYKANIPVEFNVNYTPNNLIFQLNNTLYNLITHQFSDYINLLYIIDVSEEKIKKLNTNNFDKMIEQVVFLILKREWDKVWLRENY